MARPFRPGPAGDVEGLAALRAAMGDWRDEELLTALAGAFARAGDLARAREAAQAVASEESDESYESAAWLTLVKGLVAAGLFDAARSAAVDNRYESRVTGIAIVVDALAGRGDAPDTLMPLARRTIAEASGMTGEFGQAQAYAEISTLLAERGERERARRLLDRAEAEVASIPPGGMALGTSRALACAHARLGAYDRAMERFSVWKDKAAGWRVLLEHLRALGPSAPADAAEAELKALIAVATDHDTLLLAADMARSVGDLEQMRHYLEQARAAAQADEASRFNNLCDVIKAMAAAGELASARQLSGMLERLPEWAFVIPPGPEDTGAAVEARDESDEENDEAAAEDDDGLFMDVHSVVGVAEAFHAVGESEQSDAIFERALSLAATDGSIWLGVEDTQAFVRHFARKGELGDRLADLAAVVSGKTHDWEKAQQLAAGASAATDCGEVAASHTLLRRALEYAARGGRIAFFEILERFARRLAMLGVPDVEWRLFEMCEEVDGWWLPRPDATGGPPPRGG